jgi:hypothetical protein
MKIKNVTIVMALFDIGRDTWDEFNLSYNTYLYWMKNTLSLNAKFVIYTEDKFLEQIKNHRKEFDKDFENTVIIPMELNSLPIYKNYNEKLTYLMNSSEFKKKVSFPNVPEMARPLYNVIMFNKVFFLKDAIEKKYFDNDMVIWADAGGLRESIENYKNVNWPNLDKINNLDNTKITFFSHNQDFTITDKEFHSLSQIRNIQGTCFVLPSNLIDVFTDLVVNTIEESLSGGYIGSDEKIFDICYSKQKELFNLIKCDWRQYFDILK